MSSFYSIKELMNLGLRSFGKNVLISRFSRFYNPENISIGNNVRIDDFCILKSRKSNVFEIGDYNHFSCGAYICGNGGFISEAFCTVSSGVKIYTISDSYCGNFMTNPMVPEKYLHVTSHPLTLQKHTIIGTSSIILPGVSIGEGVAIGANSLVIKECKPWGIYAGSPAKFIKERSKKLLDLEKDLLRSFIDNHTEPS